MKKWTRREFLPLVGIGLAAGTLIASNEKNHDSSPLNLRITPKRPKRLLAGDTIGICAPAGAVRRVEEVSEFTEILEGMGFRVKGSPNITKKYGYFAGTDEERASDFMQLIEDPSVKAVFCLRGGWGCARLLPLIDFGAIERNPKIIMGFSDVTTLLNAITVKSNLVTFHGPSGNSSWNAYSKSYIRRTLMDAEAVQYKNASDDSEIITYSSGKATGVLWGGNMSVVTSLIGTGYLANKFSGILFLEDVEEEPYSIDRMLTHLKLSGLLEQVNGVVLGNFRKCTAEEPERSFTLEEVFEQHFGNFGKPVFYGAQIGHAINKFTIPVGATAEIDADLGTITLINAAVE